jgi:hypothetical protein
MVEMKYANRVLVEKPERTKALEGPRPVWENDVTSDFQVKILEAVDWMYLAEDRYKWLAVVNRVMNLLVA